MQYVSFCGSKSQVPFPSCTEAENSGIVQVSLQHSIENVHTEAGTVHMKE